MLMAIVVHLLLLLLLSPLLLGVIGKTKALFAGRVGAPFLQPYFDIGKLLRKGLVVSRTTTWVFAAGPVVALAVPVVAALLIPFGALAAPVAFAGDLVLFVYLFALARFFTVAAALDTGSAFEGMGGAREATFSCLAEPTIFFAFIVLSRLSGSASLNGMLGPALAGHWRNGGAAPLGLILVALIVILLVENSRIPFDDPNTHLELTMVHEVMVLDHGGPLFGMILYGAAMKLFLLGALVVGLVLPATGNRWLDAVLFSAGMLLLAVLIGIIESVMARLRLLRIPQILVGTSLIAAFAVVLVLR